LFYNAVSDPFALVYVMSLMGSPAAWVSADLGCHEVVAVFFFAKVEFWSCQACLMHVIPCGVHFFCSNLQLLGKKLGFDRS